MVVVLEDDDLLGEVLIRVAFTTSLVRAALVCKRWLRVVSNPAFLHRFSDLHLLRLLGFYVQPKDIGFLKFVTAPSLPAELDSIARRASWALNAYDRGTSGPKVSILSCMHGYLLVRRHHSPNNSIDELLNLLPRCSRREPPVMLPRLPSDGFFYATAWLNKYMPSNGSARICAECHYLEQLKRTIRICELRGDEFTWHDLTSTAIELPVMPDAYAFMPVGSKLYLISSARSNSTARSASSSGTSCLTMITLPDGVADGYRGNFATWAAADDSVIHLIHVKELRLHVWLYAMESQNWSLEDTICLRKVCANSEVKTDLFSKDGKGTANDVKVYADWHVSDAKSVLLEVGVDVLHIDIKSRTAEKIYTKTPEDVDWDQLFPFVMIAPPMFTVIEAADIDQN